MPVIDSAHGHLLTARALHNNQKRKGTAQFGTLDWSAVIAGTRVAAGLDGFDSDKVSRPGTRFWLTKRVLMFPCSISELFVKSKPLLGD